MNNNYYYSNSVCLLLSGQVELQLVQYSNFFLCGVDRKVRFHEGSVKGCLESNVVFLAVIER
jgi:hypothetical protein